MRTKPSTSLSTPGRLGGLTIATILLAVGAVGSLWVILHFGVNLLDEALYVAMPYRFTLGDKPFIDEMNVVQSASLITYPAIKLFTLFANGADGIILFTRKLYFAFELLVAYSIFQALRRKLGWQWALLCSLLAIAFVPRGIPNLGYKSLAAGLFTIGVFLGFDTSVDDERKLSADISCGMAHGLCCVANPPFAPSAWAISRCLPSLARKKIPALSSPVCRSGSPFSGWRHISNFHTSFQKYVCITWSAEGSGRPSS